MSPVVKELHAPLLTDSFVGGRILTLCWALRVRRGRTQVLLAKCSQMSRGIRGVWCGQGVLWEQQSQRRGCFSSTFPKRCWAEPRRMDYHHCHEPISKKRWWGSMWALEASCRVPTPVPSVLGKSLISLSIVSSSLRCESIIGAPSWGCCDH